MFENKNGGDKHKNFESKAPKIEVVEKNHMKPMVIVGIAVGVVILGLVGFIGYRKVSANNKVKDLL